MTVLSAIHDKTLGLVARRVNGSIAKPADMSVDYKRLLGSDAWASLPGAVRRRFDHCAVREVSYVGCFDTVEASFAGRCLASFCRYLGEPLVAVVGENVPALVKVFGDRTGAQRVGAQLLLRQPTNPHRVFSKNVWTVTIPWLNVSDGVFACVSPSRWSTASCISVATAITGTAWGFEFRCREGGSRGGNPGRSSQ